MRKQFLFLFLALIVANTIHAQAKGTKVGYIDMEYILQNVPNYTEAQSQLEEKAQKWKQEIEVKKNEINKLKETLKAEKALLTKELINERENEITFLENETLEYQQKRFGPNGDLILQKATLTKPIQDQVFTAVQDIAEAKKYDFIFDKSSDLTMLFAAKRFDISDQVLRVINRTEKREQLTKKQLEAEQAKENKEDAIDENPVLVNRQKALDEKKAARDQIIADRKLAQEQKKKEAEDRKNQIQAEREAKKSGSPVSSTTATPDKTLAIEAAKTAAAEAKQKQADQKAKTLEDRKKIIEDRKKELEDKRKQILAEREAKKSGTVSASAKKEEVKTTVVNDSLKETTKTTAEEIKQKQAVNKAKILEDRKKAIDLRKKELEDKKKQALEDREAKKSSTATTPAKKEEPKAEVIKDSVKETTTAGEVQATQPENKPKTAEDRKKIIEDRKKALEEKRKKILEEREAAKKAAAEKLKKNTNTN
jgi:Skp family chaperone for outer membrane proteins